jgi:hypothetical protein
MMRKEDVKAVAIIAGFYLVIELLGVTCPIRFLTGISCAGCGMSRAWFSLLRLDIVSAYHYHPLFWLPVPMVILLLLRNRIPVWVFRSGMILGCMAFVLVYVIRMANPDDVIVSAHVTKGIIYRVINLVLHGSAVQI